MGIYSTAASMFSDISLTLEAVIMAIFIVGILHSRRHLADRHYKLMTIGFSGNLLFVLSYMAKSILEGGTKFPGPPEVYRSLYLPIVMVHGFASIVAFLLAGYTVYFGYTQTIQKRKRVFKERKSYLRHRKLGYGTLAAWSISFITGIAVYLFLYVLYV